VRVRTKKGKRKVVKNETKGTGEELEDWGLATPGKNQKEDEKKKTPGSKNNRRCHGGAIVGGSGNPKEKKNSPGANKEKERKRGARQGILLKRSGSQLSGSQNDKL